MAKISSFVICDTITNVSNGENPQVQALVNPQSILRPEFIPGTFSFGVSIGITGIVSDKPTDIKFEIQNPKGEIIQTSAGVLPVVPVVPGDEKLPNEYRGYQINMDLRNLTIREDGIYKLLIKINKEELSRDIPIFQRPEVK